MELDIKRQEQLYKQAVIETTKPVLTNKEVYEQYGIKKKVLADWRADGLKYSKPNGVYFYHRKSLDEYLEKYAYA